jgi:GT2 family glycosyltransferase/tetratricopeptide (TPR) repeat protein
MADKNYLGLNIIVGPSEEEELERCLKSCQGELFDEVVVTTTSDDEKVQAVAEKYADKTPFFKWVRDFAAARNYSFSHSTSKFILWLDADDVIKPSEYQKLLQLKNSGQLEQSDIVLIDYVYFHDNEDKAVVVLPRERIVRNCDAIKWHDPIHEYMNMDGQRVNRFPIRIDHYRTKPYDPNRNLTLLEQEYEKGGCSTRIKFYYGKELADNGNYEKAIPVLEDYVNTGQGFVDNLTVACIRLSRYYYHINKEPDVAKRYALRGIGFNSQYAEHYVMIGDIYADNGENQSAIRYYKDALTKELTGGMSQLVDYYGYIPSQKLAILYSNNREYEEAKKYVDIALSHKKEPNVVELDKMITREIEKVKRGAVLNSKREEEIKRVLDQMGYGIEVEKNNYDYAQLRLTREVPVDVAWLVPDEGQFDPALRIRRLNISAKLSELGYKSKVIQGYHGKNLHEVRNEVGDANTVVFATFGEYDLGLMKHLKSCGKKIVRDHCENMFGFPFEDECFKEADLITVCSTKLNQLTKDQGYNHVAIIKDAIEDRTPKSPLVYEDRYDKPKAVFMGGGGNSFLVNDVLKPQIEKAGYELVTITEWDDATIKWDKDTWPDDFCSCDVALCPQRVDQQPAKSNVKVTTAMALGVPVIAAPLQSYKEIIEHGKNGYICEKPEDWYKALVELKDPEKRKEIGTAGKNSVGEYTLEHISNIWSGHFKKLVNGQLVFHEELRKPVVEETPTLLDAVDIIIPNYQNLEYLKLCITSIMLNTLHPFNVIVSDAGSGEEVWEYLNKIKGVKVLGKPGQRLNFSQSCNAGIAASRSKFFVILNSDVVVSKGWLSNMVNKMNTKSRLASCGVLSNCDRGWKFDDPRNPKSPTYDMKLKKAGIELVPGMKMDQIKPHLDELYEFMEKSNKDHEGKFVQQDWVAAYATIYARCAIDEVGAFDTMYKNGCEDFDLGHRLNKSGYVCGQSIDSFVFHFGGVSRGAYQIEDREEYDKEDRDNHIKMKIKWRKPKIGIWTGPAWEPWDKATVDAGMAGSETWASYLADEFVRKGYEVRLYNDLKTDDPKKPTMVPVDGTGECVRYVHHTQLLNDIEFDHLDYFISSRSVAPFNYRLHVGKRYVMIHDIWLGQDPGMDVKGWLVSGYAYLSDWHKGFLANHHKQMPQDKMFLTANGVVEQNYQDVDLYGKKNQMIYSSSPDRGLYQLLKMVPEIRKEVPDFTLKVAYGFLNWESAAKQRNDTASMELIKKIKGLMDQPGVVYLDRINKEELAKHQKESKVWFYPTWFTETFCCLPDNEVTTDRGIKNIIDVSLRDKVLTHKNRYRQVEQVMSRKYSGEVIGFRIQNHGYYTGYYTPEHPIEVLSGDYVYKMRRHRKSLNSGNGPHYSAKSLEELKESPSWKSCSEVKVGDYVHIPFEVDCSEDKMYDLLDDMKKINSNYYEELGRIKYAKHRLGIPRKIKMDLEFFRFLGLYLAEGSFSSGTLNFAFHTKEKEYQTFIQDYLKDTFAVDSYLKKDGNSTSVKANSYPLGRWLKHTFNGNARSKKVPTFLYSQSKENIGSFIKGAFEGDGYDGGNEHKISLASKEAILGIMRLCHKIGLHPNHSRSERCGRYYYHLGLSNSLWDFVMNGISSTKKHYHVFFEYEGNIYYKVKEIKKKDYKGYVYNLEVEEDHSYVSNGISVHNCIGAVENGLSKNAILSTDLAGLSTTAGNAGILYSPEGLTRDGDYPSEFCEKFIKTAVRLLKDEEYRKKWADKAHNKMSGQYLWSNIADEWIKKFEE